MEKIKTLPENKCGKGGGCIITLLPVGIEKTRLDEYKQVNNSLKVIYKKLAEEIKKAA